MSNGYSKPDSKFPATATPEDIRRILGDLDDEKLMAIVDLKPTVQDVELASLWLGGDPDVFGAGEPLKGAASSIVTILTADEEEAARAR